MEKTELEAAILAASKVAAMGDMAIEKHLTEYERLYGEFLVVLKKRDRERVSGPEAWFPPQP